MPSASSKPANQTASMEAQDTAKLLIGMMEKKVRNLEKRKSKLENYRQMANDGKTLNKDQETAVAHFDEVQGMLEFAKDLQKTFATVVIDSVKQTKKQIKKEESLKHELENKRIRDILLLQNVLDHLGNEKVRADFQSGSNGAVLIKEGDLNLFDEFYKLINPTREELEEKDPDGENTIKKSFDEKLNEAGEHLNCYMKAEDKQACEGATLDKELKNLVDQIHDCGYLDNIPEFPEIDEVPAVPSVMTAIDEPVSAVECEFAPEEEVIEEHVLVASQAPVDHTASSTDYGMFSAEQIADPSDASEEAALPIMVPAEPTQAQIDETQAYSSEHSVPEPIEMPPVKGQHIDVTEVLAEVQGSFNFVQDSMVHESMVDYESPHMDPAVLAVSPAYITTQNYTVTPQLSMQDPSHVQPTLQLGQTAGMERTIPDPITSSQTLNTQASLTTAGTLSDQSYNSTELTYGSTQSAYDRPSQGLQPGLVVQQTISSQQTMTSQQTLNSQQVLSNQSTLVGNSQTGLGQGSLGVSAQTQGLGELSDYSSAQVETQLKTEDQTSLVSGTSSLHNPMMQQPQQSSLSHSVNPSTSTTQLNPAGSLQQQSGLQQDGNMQQSMQQPDTASSYSQSLGSSQMSNESLSTQMAGSASGNLGMTDHTKGMPMHSTHGTVTPPVTQSSSNISAPKSTMNASAPPFQMTGSQRSSPQMQTMQASQQQQQPPQDMGSFQSMDQGEVDTSQTHMSDDSSRTPPSVSNEDSTNDYKGRSSYTSYNSNYQPPNSYRNGNRGSRGGSGGRGGNSNMNSPSTYRNNRSGMPFVRTSGPRYASQQSPRTGGPNYNQGYIPRDSYSQRAPPQEMGFNPNPSFGSFGGRPHGQQQDYYRRGGPPRGPTSRGGRGMGGPRGQNSYRGGPRGGFGKSPNQQSGVTV